MSVIQFFVFLKILFRENQNTAHEITQKPIKYISTKMKKNVANAHSKRIFSTFKGHLFTVTLATSLLLASNLQLQAQNIKETQSLPHASLSATHPQSPIGDLAAKRTEWKKMKGDVVLYMANDLGQWLLRSKAHCRINGYNGRNHWSRMYPCRRRHSPF